ncbi:unnamed protein product [Vitrella brassicaformis CCMP3155]|uniref:Uncharacterized protein n=2 Tax=Vitrella brassicaformis TaxID=1169539 RepID=A0A0G4EGL0_VITBC|nr:unnamed protein product [Vitrella brassicaformis CCMP3155]|eukprot:CEL94620.1 unnamed protein product [Vitrella brassicaformis CCMP3155]
MMSTSVYECIEVMSQKKSFVCVRTGRAAVDMGWSEQAEEDKICVEVAIAVDPVDKGFLCFAASWPQGLDGRPTCIPWRPKEGGKTWEDSFLCLERRDNPGLYRRIVMPECTETHYSCSTAAGEFCDKLQTCNFQVTSPALLKEISSPIEGKAFCRSWNAKFIANPDYTKPSGLPDEAFEWHLILVSPDSFHGYRLRVTRPRCCTTPFGKPCFNNIAAPPSDEAKKAADEPASNSTRPPERAPPSAPMDQESVDSLFRRLSPVGPSTLKAFLQTISETAKTILAETRARAAGRPSGKKPPGKPRSHLVDELPPLRSYHHAPETKFVEVRVRRAGDSGDDSGSDGSSDEGGVSKPGEGDASSMAAELAWLSLTKDEAAIMEEGRFFIVGDEVTVGCDEFNISANIPRMRYRFQRHAKNDTIFFLDVLPMPAFLDLFGLDYRDWCMGTSRFDVGDDEPLCLFKRATYTECKDTTYGDPCVLVKEVPTAELELLEGPPLVPNDFVGRFVRAVVGGKAFPDVYLIVREPGQTFVRKRIVVAPESSQGCCRVKHPSEILGRMREHTTKGTHKILKTCDRDNPLTMECSASKIPHFFDRIVTDMQKDIICQEGTGDWHEVGVGDDWVIGCLAVGGGCVPAVPSVDLCMSECEAIQEAELCNAFNYYENPSDPRASLCCLQSCPDPTKPVQKNVRPEQVRGWTKYVNHMVEKGIDIAMLPFPSPGCSAVVLQNRDASNGIYTFNVAGKATRTYCVFDRERGHIWTFIRSIRLADYSVPGGFRGVPFTADVVAAGVRMATMDKLVKEPPKESFNVNYGVLKAMLEDPNAAWTHFMATCNFDTSQSRDYILVELTWGDPFPIAFEAQDQCIDILSYDIRGDSCNAPSPCALPFSQGMGKYDFHVDSSKAAEGACAPDKSVTRAKKGGEDNFGYYKNVNKEFTCSYDDDSTTNFWLGEKFSHPSKLCGYPFEYEMKPGFKCTGDVMREMDWLGQAYGTDRSRKETVCRGECTLQPLCAAYSLQAEVGNETSSTCTLCKRADRWESRSGVWSGYKLYDPASKRPCSISDGCFVQAMRSETAEGMACDHSEGALPTVLPCRGYLLDEMLKYRVPFIGCYEVQRERHPDSVGDTWCNLYDTSRTISTGGSFRAGRVLFPLCDKSTREESEGVDEEEEPRTSTLHTPKSNLTMSLHQQQSLKRIGEGRRPHRPRRGWIGGWGVYAAEEKRMPVRERDINEGLAWRKDSETDRLRRFRLRIGQSRRRHVQRNSDKRRHRTCCSYPLGPVVR